MMRNACVRYDDGAVLYVLGDENFTIPDEGLIPVYALLLLMMVVLISD